MVDTYLILEVKMREREIENIYLVFAINLQNKK